MKLTPWFPPEIKPIRVGWYQRKWRKDNDWFANYWDGAHWHHSESATATTQIPIEPHYEAICHCENMYWRGLAKKP